MRQLPKMKGLIPNLLMQEKELLLCEILFRIWKPTVALISRYRREVSNLKAEKEQLFRVVDRLSNQNQRLDHRD